MQTVLSYGLEYMRSHAFLVGDLCSRPLRGNISRAIACFSSLPQCSAYQLSASQSLYLNKLIKQTAVH